MILGLAFRLSCPPEPFLCLSAERSSDTDSAGDNVDAGEGDDIVIGGLGTDHLEGGEGDDLIWGHGASDILLSGAAADHLLGDGIIQAGRLQHHRPRPTRQPLPIRENIQRVSQTDRIAAMF